MTEREALMRDAGDVAAGVLTIGVVADVVPVILGLLGICWFGVRLANWVRVAFLGKEPWELR